MIYLLFKTINSDTSIGVSNLKGEIEKANFDKFGDNVKELLDDMSSNYNIIIDKEEQKKDYVFHLLKYLMLGPN